MSSISLCIITKNEEKYLEQCINSVKSIIDEIIIADTGSTDDTIEIARDICKNFGTHAKIFEVRWQDSFSAAKNEALKHATKEWTLVLDADEVIGKEDLKKIRNAIENPGDNVAFSLEQRSYIKKPFIGAVKNKSDFELARNLPFFISHFLVRLFKNNTGLEFRHRVHELIEDSIREKNLKFSKLDVVLHHFGSVKEHGFVEGKAELYTKLILKQLEEAPESPRYNYQAARMFLGRNDLDSALKYLEKTAKINPDYRLIFSEIAKIYLQMRELNKAEEYFKKSINQKPDDLSAYNNLAVTYMMMKQFEDARKLLEKQIEKHPDNNALRHNYNKLKDISQMK